MSSPPWPARKDAVQIFREPLSRRGFLTRAGLAIGTGSAVLLAACGSGDEGGETNDKDRDVAILHHALVLELTAVAVYRRASEPLGGKALEAFESFLTQEQEHADALTKAIKQRGGSARAEPARLEGPAIKTRRGALALAADLENVLIAAYLGAVTKLSASDLRAITAEIVNVEAGHLAVIHGELGRPQAPDAFVSGDPDALSGADLENEAIG